MILEFSVENYKSFQDLQVLSLQTAALKEVETDISFKRTHQIEGAPKIVKTKAIYGANASGKSNMIAAMASFWRVIYNCLQPDNVLIDVIDPYRLTEHDLLRPSYFQIIILIKGVQYRYGFEADRQKIHSEWLYVKHKAETEYFIREGQEIISYNKNRFSEIKQIVDKNNKLFKENTLILSVLNALNAPVSAPLFEKLTRGITISVGDMETSFWKKFSIDFFHQNLDYKAFAIDLLKGVDDTISDFTIKESKKPFSGDFTEIQNKITITRQLGDSKAYFNFDKEEGEGTQKMFGLSGALYNVLKSGYALIVDELDARLHPKLTRQIIEMFYSEWAHDEAQLIFVTHDTNLLDAALLRRDQITFVEKNKNGASEVYDLSDVKGVREKDLFEKNYLRGKYGGLPYLKQLENSLING